MLERLTERTSDGIAYTKIPPIESHLNKRGVIEQCFTGFVVDRLAAYEDSELSPEEVKQLIVSDESKEQSSIKWFNRAKELQDELNSYKQAEADGRLVVLPCKVGENCFAVNHTEKKILEITVSEYSYSIWHDAWIISAANGCRFFLDNAYRTREAAEKALGVGE